MSALDPFAKNLRQLGHTPCFLEGVKVTENNEKLSKKAKNLPFTRKNKTLNEQAESVIFVGVVEICIIFLW
jgi:hypothetical protein